MVVGALMTMSGALMTSHRGIKQNYIYSLRRHILALFLSTCSSLGPPVHLDTFLKVINILEPVKKVNPVTCHKMWYLMPR